jgi:prepilin-type N-terminal cleavage/methylation domain-containing protein
MTRQQQSTGFTLAELLISLAILGVIAAFAIPKVLQSSQDNKLNAIAKETASMVRDAYSFYKIDTNPTWNLMGNADRLIGYLNYVEIDRTTTAAQMMDPPPTQTKLENCTNAQPCLVLHSGAYVQMDSGMTFTAADPAPNRPALNNAVFFNIDPDGVRGQAGRVSIVLFFNGRVTTGQAANDEGVVYYNNTITPQTTDPEYLSYWN